MLTMKCKTINQVNGYAIGFVENEELRAVWCEESYKWTIDAPGTKYNGQDVYLEKDSDFEFNQPLTEERRK